MPTDQQSALRPEYPIRTARLLLRPLTNDDVDALLAYRSRPDVCRYVPFEPMTREAMIERLASHYANTELTDEGQSLTLGFEIARTGELIGDVVLFWHSRKHGGGEIGYVMHPDFRGHGYATEAARAVIERGFRAGVPEVYAVVRPGNSPSMAVCRRLGMSPLGRLRRWYDVELEAFRLTAPECGPAD